MFLNNADRATILNFMDVPTRVGDFSQRVRFIQNWLRNARANGQVA